jgi:hypothetical protein
MHLKVLTIIFSYLAGTALGHGYLADPPGRASAWRYGFDTPVDLEDDHCDCGGIDYQYNEMGGQCGICGDPWDQDPRAHEVGGPYATGTIVRDYVQGQVIQAAANITGNHLGHFEYKICANNDVTVEATQECLDLTPLYAADGGDWLLEIDDTEGIISFDLQLPADLTCTQCVFQWRYVAANTVGTCANGTEALGCGPQEEFRSCADVAILPANLDV